MIDVIFVPRDIEQALAKRSSRNTLREIAFDPLRDFAAISQISFAPLYPGFDSANWYAMFVPAGTPPAVIGKLHSETISALKAPDIRDFMTGEGVELVGSTPAELTAYLRREIGRYGKVIKAANIRAE